MKIRASILTLFAIAIIGGCKSTTIVENSTGKLHGTVNVYGGANCMRLTNDTGVRIQIEGTSFSSTTDSAGNWSMDNIPAGIYNILLISPTHDTTLVSQYQFSGAGTQFLLNQDVYDVKLVGNDSVPFLSVSVLKNATDLNRGTWNYVVSSTMALNGPDSEASFTFYITDLNRTISELSYYQSLSSNLSISNVSQLVIKDSFIHYPFLGDTVRDSVGHFDNILHKYVLDSIAIRVDTSYKGYTSPQPGDTLQVVTSTNTPFNACKTGGGVINCYRKIVLQ